MKFSLVLATIGRVNEVERFLQSLDSQTWKDFELLLVDQNTDGQLDELVKNYQACFSLSHLHSAPGLSRARNVGLQSISGDIIAFPDDDCWYPQSLLEQVAGLFQGHLEWDGVTGIARNEEGGLSRFHWDGESGPVTKWNVWKRGVSISIFLRRKVIEAVGGFDERLGLGAGTPWGSGEETDYLLRADEEKMVIMYRPDLVVHHEDHLLTYGADDAIKARLYGGGMGFVMRKHHYPINWVLAELGRPLAIALISFITIQWQRSKYFLSVLAGRLNGYFI
jgi:glycosyltransferase involved in cell wall biosynthesis